MFGGGSCSNTLLAHCMTEDASVYLATFSDSVSFLVQSFFFQCKSELLFYLILSVPKMPFIRPVSIVRSVSGLSIKEKPVNASSSTTKHQKAVKSSSVKERLTSNLKQLGKKDQPRTHLLVTKEASGAELHAKRCNKRLLPSAQTGSYPASSSSESLSKREQHKQSSVKSNPEVKTRGRHQEKAHFTLTLTPEAVLLLQRRNSERRQRSASRNAGSGAAGSGSASNSRRKRDDACKKHQTATQRQQSTQNSRVSAKNNADAELGDISSILKISLLNEQHKYDDVEYEDEQGYGVDERVVLKCTEWLRGLENTPVTMGNSLQAV